MIMAAVPVLAQQPSAQNWQPFAGFPAGAGLVDGTGRAALFSSPAGVALDAAGNAYVADTGNNVIRKVTPDGVVTTFAGSPSAAAGTADGQGPAAAFNHPQGIAADADGTLYVADTGSHTIRKITADGTVSTVAGTPGVSGSADGAGAVASFLSPSGVAAGAAGTLYVADTGNHTVRQIISGTVSTLAGTAGVSGSADGTGGAASFLSPLGVAVNAAGTVFVADTGNYTVRQIINGAVTTLAGSAGVSGTADGTGAAASFMAPAGIGAEPAGDVYVTDQAARTLRRISAGGTVATVAGLPAGTAASSAVADEPAVGGPANRATSWPGNAVPSVDGVGQGATFSAPWGVAVGTGFQVVADTGGQTLRLSRAGLPRFPGSVSSAYVVTTLAGAAAGPSALGSATAVACDSSSSRLVVADKGGNTIRTISPEGVVYVLAGTAEAGSEDGFGPNSSTGPYARFNQPSGVAVTGGGLAFVADTGNFTIRQVTAGGVVTTLAGSPGLSGTDDGTGSSARFGKPESLAVDGSNNVYVADNGNFSIRKVTPAGVVTTLMVLPSRLGGLAVRSGSIFVALPDSYRVVMIDALGHLNIYAGTGSTPGNVDGNYTLARFGSPASLAFDSSGALFVADTLNQTIRRISPNGSLVSTVGGQAGRAGNQPGLGTQALFTSPSALGIGPTGTLYVSHLGGASLVSGSVAPVLTLDAPVPAGNGSGFADVHGTLLANGNDGTLYFDFGPTAAYGTSVIAGTFHGVDAVDQPAVDYNLHHNFGPPGTIHGRFRTATTSGADATTADVAFSTGGPTTPDFADASYAGGSIAVAGPVHSGSLLMQADGRILQTGAGTGCFIAGRWDTAGQPDTGYGFRGLMMDPQANIAPYITGTSAALQSGDRLIMVGTSDLGVVIARYTRDGTPDTSFGTTGTGTVFTFDAGEAAQGTCVAVQPDDKILVAGHTRSLAGDLMFLLRYLPDGTRDTTFGTGGSVLTPVATGPVPAAIVVQPDGRIVVGGSTLSGSANPGAGNTSFTLVRYNADGSLDASFGQYRGYLFYSYANGSSCTLSSLALAPDGSLVAAGRCTIAGRDNALTATFDPSGRGTTHTLLLPRINQANVQEQDNITALAAQATGPFYTVGDSFDGQTTTSGWIEHWDAHGAADTAFNAGLPLLLPPVAGGSRHLTGVGLDRDNRPVAGGTITDSTGATRLTVLRLAGGSPSLHVLDEHGAIASGTTEAFPPTLPGHTAVRTFTLVNTGSQPILINQLSLTGNDAADFTLSGPAATTSIAVGASATVTVTFKPVQAGPKQATISLLTDDPTAIFFQIPLIADSYEVGFLTAGATVAEAPTSVRIPVHLSSALDKAFTLPFTFDESPQVNAFTPANSILTFPARTTTAYITVTVKNDNAITGDHSIMITLGTPSDSRVSLGAQQTYSLTIQEDDVLPSAFAQSVVYASLGQSLVLDDTTSGSPPLRLSWKKDGVAIRGSTNTLTLPPAALTTAGAYTLTVANHHPAVSATTQVVVVDTADHVVRIDKGGSATLTAVAAGHGLTYHWAYNGVGLRDGNKYSGTATRTLAVRSTSPGDTGDYTCVITCQQQTKTTGKHTLRVPAQSPTTMAPDFPTAVVLNAYGYQIPYDTSAAGATQTPTRFQCANLPAGLVCEATTGFISGKALQAGTYHPVVTLVNGWGPGAGIMGTLTIQAFPTSLAGIYEASFETQDPSTSAVLEGRLDLSVTAAGLYVGTVKYRNLVQAISGVLSTLPDTTAGGVPTSAGASIALTIGGAQPAVLLIDLTVTPTYMSGTASLAGSSVSSSLNGWRNVWNIVTNPLTTRLGLHAFDLSPSDATDATVPQGHGYGVAMVSAPGVVTLTGRAADGQVFASTGILGPAGEVIVWQPLAGGRDMLYGSFAIQDDTAHTITNLLTWTKGAPATTHDYPAFSQVALGIDGGAYVPASPVLGITVPAMGADATLTFAGGGLAASAVNPNVQVRISAANMVSFPGTNPANAALSLTPATGAFSGRFTLKDGNTTRLVTFQGQLVPSLGQGVGYFLLPQLGGNPRILSGSVVLEGL